MEIGKDKERASRQANRALHQGEDAESGARSSVHAEVISS
jgi:hypothetical protein